MAWFLEVIAGEPSQRKNTSLQTLLAYMWDSIFEDLIFHQLRFASMKTQAPKTAKQASQVQQLKYFHSALKPPWSSMALSMQKALQISGCVALQISGCVALQISGCMDASSAAEIGLLSERRAVTTSACEVSRCRTWSLCSCWLQLTPMS